MKIADEWEADMMVLGMALKNKTYDTTKDNVLKRRNSFINS